MTISTGRMHCWLGIIGYLLFLNGCSGGLLEIQGEVTLDGKPIETGTINFSPAEGSGPTAGTIINGGRYWVKTYPGTKSVSIQGYRKTGQEHTIPNDPTSPLVNVNKQIVPARFNTHQPDPPDRHQHTNVEFPFIVALPKVTRVEGGHRVPDGLRFMDSKSQKSVTTRKPVPTSPLVEIHEPIVPEKHNVASSLQMNIDGSQNDANFALSSR